MRSTEKMKKLLNKTCDYQAKVNDNLEKFNSLLEKHFSVLIDSSNDQRIFLTYLA